MLQLIKRMIYEIKILLNVISRPTGSNRPQKLLQGYIYILKDELIGTIRIGSSISQNKIEDIKKHYYKGSRYKLTIVKQTHSATHKQRREVLSELQNYFVQKYSENHIVIQI